jgi:flagellar assembly protein FliH
MRAEPARSEPVTPEPLRGAAAERAVLARLDTDLRPAPLTHRFGTSVRLADPVLEEALAATRAHVRRAATAEGYAQGHAAGVRAARARTEAVAAATAERDARTTAANAVRVEAALAGLRRAADALEAAALPTLQAAEDLILHTAVDLAQALLGRELTLSAAAGLDGGLEAVGRALASVPGSRPITVRLHPADLAVLDQARAGALPAAGGRVLEFVADPAVELGGAIAQCDAVRIDAQLGAALTRIREVLEA